MKLDTRQRRSLGLSVAVMACCVLLAGVVSAGAQAQAAYATLPGVRLWFVDSGGAGVPVVLLHPNTGTSEIWKHQIEPLSRAGYRVITFDRRGWGKSLADPATGAQPGSVAGDLHALAEHLHLERFYIVGVAGGGFVALDYAAWHPEKVIAMVVGATTGQISEREMQEMTARIAIPGLTELPLQYREVGASFRAISAEGLAEWMAIEARSQQDGAPAQPLHTLNTYAKLETIRAPVLILAGDADLVAPPGLMKVWGAHLKNGQFDFIPDAGHAMAWERPDLFNEKVLQFLRKTQAP